MTRFAYIRQVESLRKEIFSNNYNSFSVVDCSKSEVPNRKFIVFIRAFTSNVTDFFFHKYIPRIFFCVTQKKE